jgi:hypothetical protein
MSYATVGPRQICYGLFTNLTENFLISLYFLNRRASSSRMPLPVLTLTAGSSVTKNLRLFKLALVLVRLDHVARFIVNADRYSVWGSAAPSPGGEFSLAISRARFQFGNAPLSQF